MQVRPGETKVHSQIPSCPFQKSALRSRGLNFVYVCAYPLYQCCVQVTPLLALVASQFLPALQEEHCTVTTQILGTPDIPLHGLFRDRCQFIGRCYQSDAGVVQKQESWGCRHNDVQFLKAQLSKLSSQQLATRPALRICQTYTICPRSWKKIRMPNVVILIHRCS